MSITSTSSIEKEHEFWLHVLHDHLIFIAESSKVDVPNLLELLDKSNELREGSPNTSEVLDLALSVRDLKRSLLARILRGEDVSHLPATFLNHTLNEIDHAIALFTAYEETGEVPVLPSLNHHHLWLSDAKGHAISIIQKLDPTEKPLMKKLKKLKKKFAMLFEKTHEFAGSVKPTELEAVGGYLRSGVYDFPAIDKLDEDAKVTMLLFVHLLEEIHELKLADLVLGTFNAHLISHMLMEEEYYLSKIGAITHE